MFRVSICCFQKWRETKNKSDWFSPMIKRLGTSNSYLQWLTWDAKKNCRTVVGWSTAHCFMFPSSSTVALEGTSNPPGNSRVRLRSLASSETPEPPTSHRLRFIIYGVRAQATGTVGSARYWEHGVLCHAVPRGWAQSTSENTMRSVSVSIVAGMAVMCSSCTSFRSCLWIV